MEQECPVEREGHAGGPEARAAADRHAPHRWALTLCSAATESQGSVHDLKVFYFLKWNHCTLYKPYLLME